MRAYTLLITGLALSASVLTGCGGKDMPEPKEPKVEPSFVNDPLPEPKALKAGLIITSSPEGVEIAIDGKVVGKTPLEVNDLEPGAYDVSFLFEGDKMTQTVNLSEGETQRLNQNVWPDSSDAIMGK